MPPLRLEVFEMKCDNSSSGADTALTPLEEARLASYEQGYTAGWEDAVKAQNDEKAQVSADLAHNLQSLSFTYHEARAHVLKGLEPLLMALVGQVLPEVAQLGLPALIQKALMPLADQAADTPITLLFNPAARHVIEPIVANGNGPPFALVEEPTLGEGQVFLQLGNSEIRIDLDGAVAGMKHALHDFFTLSAKDPQNG